MKIFIDANIILDFLDTNRVKHNIASQLFKSINFNHYELFISEDMLTNIFYISEDKKQTLRFFKTIQYKWKITHFGDKVIKGAIDLSLEKNLDLEDVLQCLCAKKNNCDVLITSDKYFYDCGVKIQTASEFLND
jgi:predicted nucleic acid-binding protein